MFNTFDYIKLLHRYKYDETRKQRLVKSLCIPLNIDNYKNICIVGYNSGIIPKNNQKITIIEPTYYNFYENKKNLTYFNKFCFKNSRTHFDLLVNSDQDYNTGINPREDLEPNTITIDEAGNFDLILVYAINCVYESVLGAINNIKNHTTIAFDIFPIKYQETYNFLNKFYQKSYLCTHNNNILVCFK